MQQDGDTRGSSAQAATFPDRKIHIPIVQTRIADTPNTSSKAGPIRCPEGKGPRPHPQ